MKNSLNKKIVAIVAVIALVAILGVCLVACNNQQSFEKRMKDKGYTVEVVASDQLKAQLDGKAEWGIVASKGEITQEGGEYAYVSIVKFKKESDAKSFENATKEQLGEVEGYSVVRNGAIVFTGTTDAVNDAKK